MPKLTSQVNEFLNPKSMMTPGLAGGFTMTIANTLWVQFGVQPKWCALGLSFTLGLLVFAGSRRTPVWQRLIYYLFNSLIIFSVGTGVNYYASKASQPPGSPVAVGDGVAISRLDDGLFSLLAGEAVVFAQPPPGSQTPSPTPCPSPPPTPRPFFRQW